MSAPPGKPSPKFDTVIQSCIFSILIYTPLALGGNRMWAITPVHVVTLLAFCVFLLKLNVHGAGDAHQTPLGVPMALIFALAFFSCCVSAYPHDSVLELYRVLTYLAIYFLIVHVIDTKAKMGRLVGVIVGVGAMLSFLGIVLYLGHTYYNYWLPGESLSATYMSRDHFAGYLEMAMPLAAALLFTDIEKAKKALVGFILIVMIVAFVLAASRGAWVSLLTACAVLLPFLQRKRYLNRILLAIIVCVLLSYFALSQFDLSMAAARARSIVEGVGVDDARLQIWLGASELIKAHPLVGTGIGTFVHVFPQATFRPSGAYSYSLIDYAHNDYLQMAVELGFMGLAVMLWVIVGALWCGLREFWTSRGHFKRSILLGACIGVMSMALHSFVDFNLHIPANAILFVTLIAIIMAMRGRRRYD